MYKYDEYLVYELSDEAKFSAYEISLISEFRRATSFWKEKICEDFGIPDVPQIATYFMEGDIDGNKVLVHTEGVAVSSLNAWGKLVEPKVFFSLPYMLANTQDMLEDTVPHEVLHVIATHVYQKYVGHDWQWVEFMKYYKLSPTGFNVVDNHITEKAIAHMRYDKVPNELR